MLLLARIIRFNRRDVGLTLVVWAVLVGYFVYRYPTPRFAISLVSACLLLFVLPYPFRSIVVLDYVKFRRPLTYLFYVIIAMWILMRFVGYSQYFHFGGAAYLSLALGTVFWAGSDPMMDMVEWLAHPLEFGRPPDAIQHFGSCWINWPSSEEKPVKVDVLRFLYDDKWDYGITGPLTFAFGEQNLEGKSADEICATYRDWYQRENIGSHFHKTNGIDSAD